MRSRRALLVTALAAVCGLTAGCFTGTASQGPQRLRVALPFPPTQAMSPWNNDGALLTKLGVAETLVGLDRSGRVEPLLAESWTRPSGGWVGATNGPSNPAPGALSLNGQSCAVG